MNKILTDNKNLNIINDTSNIDYEISDNCNLVINFFAENVNDMNINIIQNNNSLFVLNYSGIIQNDAKININVFINGDNNKSIFNGRFVGKNGYGKINATLNVKAKTANNIVSENLKGLIEDGVLEILPILEVNTNEVEANHNLAIGSIDNNALFYLQTKGLSYNTAYELLKTSFIYNIFDKDFRSLLSERRKNE